MNKPPQASPPQLLQTWQLKSRRWFLTRFLLRAPIVEDFPLYAEVMCNERGQYMGGPLSRDDAWWNFVQLASGWMLHGHGGWSIVDVDSEELLGFVILGLEPGDKQIELGVLVSEANEGLGIAHEAAQMARAFAFDTLKLTELASYVHKDNARSIALAERLGATAHSARRHDAGLHSYQ